MTQTVRLRFTLDFLPRSPSFSYLNRFPLFDYWLPDGEGDAITLRSDESINLSVYFLRCVQWVHGTLEYTDKPAGISATELARQSPIPAGPLRGSLSLHDVDDDEFSAMSIDAVGDGAYIRLGKRIVQRIIFPDISRFIQMLRITYGQYWLEELHPWDSRYMSLGEYCNNLYLEWFDSAGNWHEFKPNERTVTAVMTIRTSSDRGDFYLSENDWREIQTYIDNGTSPSLASEIAVRSYHLLLGGNIRQAFVEAVTALELAIGEFFRMRLEQSKPLDGASQSFWSLSLPAQYTIVTALALNIETKEIEAGLEAIKIRNQVVHDGVSPRENQAQYLRALVRVVSRLTLEARPRLVSGNTSVIVTPEGPGPANEIAGDETIAGQTSSTGK